MNLSQQRDTTTIRQTVTFKASPQDVYETLMDTAKHEALSGEKASISRAVGGAFTALGAHISWFNLVPQPGSKIVQAWPPKDFWPHHYSISTLQPLALGGGPELNFN